MEIVLRRHTQKMHQKKHFSLVRRSATRTRKNACVTRTRCGVLFTYFSTESVATRIATFSGVDLSRKGTQTQQLECSHRQLRIDTDLVLFVIISLQLAHVFIVLRSLTQLKARSSRSCRTTGTANSKRAVSVSLFPTMSKP